MPDRARVSIAIPHGHRKDIDGLRAVAIVPVVLYHAGVDSFSGGFVGVDVFFVISGYLITGLILADIRQSSFSIVAFYERRARRIMPALFTVLSATCVASYFILFPADFKNFGQSVVATALFASNILFSIESGGYFASTAKPLLHTWSLSVEEQFYIIWPILLLVATRLRWRIQVFAAAVSVVSFALAIWATATHPIPAFYLAPFRAWELGLGALLATEAIARTSRRGTRELGAIAGIALIFVSVFLYSEATPFPGLAAVPPCLGTALLIYTGGAQPTLMSRILSQRPFVFVGLISYSLYLWHWPVIVLYRYLADDYLTMPRIVAIVAISSLLAVLSWRFVEQPFRERRHGQWRISAKSVFAASGASIVAAIGFGGAIHLDHGWWWRLTAEAATLHRAAIVITWPECLADGGGGVLSNRQPCIRGAAGPVRTAVWGDSHALALLPGIVLAADRAGERVLFYGQAGCPPATGIERTHATRHHSCNAYGTWALKQIANDGRVHTVVLASRLQAYVERSLYGPQEERLPDPTFVGADGSIPSSQSDLVLAATGNVISALRQAGKRVVIVYPIPEIGRNVPNELTRISMNGGALDDFYLAANEFTARARRTSGFLDSIPDAPDLLRIRPTDALCGVERCVVVKNGVSLYEDDNHLSTAGAIELSPLFDGVFAAGAKQ